MVGARHPARIPPGRGKGSPGRGGKGGHGLWGSRGERSGPLAYDITKLWLVGYAIGIDLSLLKEQDIKKGGR